MGQDRRPNAEDAADLSTGQHRRGRAQRLEPARLQDADLIAEPRGKIEIMQDGEHRTAGPQMDFVDRITPGVEDLQAALERPASPPRLVEGEGEPPVLQEQPRSIASP